MLTASFVLQNSNPNKTPLTIQPLSNQRRIHNQQATSTVDHLCSFVILAHVSFLIFRNLFPSLLPSGIQCLRKLTTSNLPTLSVDHKAHKKASHSLNSITFSHNGKMRWCDSLRVLLFPTNFSLPFSLFAF